MSNKAKRVEAEYLGVAEAEAMTGMSRWFWRRQAYTGRVASTKVGDRLLIPVAEIRRVIAEGYRPASEAAVQ